MDLFADDDASVSASASAVAFVCFWWVFGEGAEGVLALRDCSLEAVPRCWTLAWRRVVADVERMMAVHNIVKICYCAMGVQMVGDVG